MMMMMMMGEERKGHTGGDQKDTSNLTSWKRNTVHRYAMRCASHSNARTTNTEKVRSTWWCR